MFLVANLLDNLFTPNRPWGLNARQARAYRQLQQMTDRQLADIGITRGLIGSVVVEGPQSVADIVPAGSALLPPANQDRLHKAA